MTKNNAGKKIALGAALGAAVGFVTGILTAPKSGKETRQDIKEAASKAKTEAEKKLKELHTDISHLVDEGKKRVASLSGKAEKEMGEQLDRGKAVLQKVKEMLSALHEGDADDPELKKAIDEAQEVKKHLRNYLANK